MDDNQRRFVEDALDLLNELDEGLMQLEASPHASAPLEQVFRTMHTIKGGANMFGFENIGELAHQLETLYDLVREGKLQVSDGLISITLHAFDKVRDLLKETDASKIGNSKDLQDHLAVAMQFLQSAEAEMSDLGHDFGKVFLKKDQLATFLITVTPTVNITADGNHPLIFIIKDLESLGTSKSFCFLKNNDEVKSWDIFLCTTSAQTEIESYFIFVENDCAIEYKRLMTTDLFEFEEFKRLMNTPRHEPVDVADLQRMISSLAESNQTKIEEQASEQTPADINKARRDTYIKVSKRKIDDLLNAISELIILHAQLVNAAAGSPSSELLEVTEQLEAITNNLRDTGLEIGLVPIETLVTKFKRVVRDLAKSLGKKVNFLSEGADTEMDKDLIELMSEPMIHIIRNAIDHGIEAPAERKAAGKSEHGTVRFTAFNTNAYVNIVISDDGKGIDKKRVLQKAIEKQLVSPGAHLTDDQIHDLIFHSGLSTANAISNVSGRGVGMDAVKQKINDLRGYVYVKSTAGKGTSIHIKLPLSRSIIEGLLVKVDDTRYVVPLNVVDRIDRILYKNLTGESYVNNSIIVNEEMLSVFSLRQHFHTDSTTPKTADIISVNINGVKKGIAVDRIEGKIQTVMKPLGEFYQQLDFIAGSSILGDGSMALVLDPSRLFSTSY